MYMLLAILVSIMILNFNKRGRDAIVYILFICLQYAVIDEYHQFFIYFILLEDV
jgi:VanZ family protein